MPKKYGLVTSGTTSATMPVRPELRARPDRLGAYPSSRAASRTREAVRSLTRPGLVSAREAVEMATPLAAATSRRVGGLVIGPRRAMGSAGPTGPTRSHRCREDLGWQLWANVCLARRSRLRWDRTARAGEVAGDGNDRRRCRRRDGAFMPTDHG